MTPSELPHDFLAEKSLLGCLLADSRAVNDLTDLGLVASDFYHPQYQIVYDVISELKLSQSAIDYVTVCSKLADRGKLEMLHEGEHRGRDFVLELLESQASTANVYHYAKSVKDKSTLRNIIRLANKISEQGKSFAGDIKEFIGEVEGSLLRVTQTTKRGDLKKLSECLIDCLETLERDRRRPGELSGLSTGFDALDGKLLGMQAGQLLIVAARPGMGKTSLGMNIAVNSIKRAQLPVIVFSLEMSATELSMRLLSSEAKIDSKQLRTKNLRENELKSLGRAVQRLTSYPIFVVDDGGTTLFDIQGICRKIKHEHGLGMVVVDYIQLMQSHTKTPMREQQIAEISRGLKSLAKELECPILALSQLNRAVEGRSDKRPTVSDLRESGSLEQDADVVMLIYRDDTQVPERPGEKGETPMIAEIIVGKNRSGETGTVKLVWRGSYTSFEPISAQQTREDYHHA